ncbi:MAG: molybdopterin-dependent oxidoreductase [Elusimicrobia bacterium]|nr:molybdopterin-dependent oxidoreductase [Elusimicrobiota bacterium]
MAAGLAIPKAIRATLLAPKQKPLPKLESEAYVPAVCKQCPALCMLQIRLVNGKPAGVSGMPAHPLNQGAMCPKGAAILQELYHPDRLRHPLRRRGARAPTGRQGTNQWDRISWDEACEMLRAKLGDLVARKKPEALGMIAAPIRDIRHEIQKRFAQAFGTPNFWEWNWSLGQAPVDAFEKMHGFSEGLFYDLANANLVVSFGWDWLQAFPSPIEAQRAYAELRRGRPERRARILHIEPRLSTTAAKADEWFAIRPGTEGVLALGVAHVLVKERLYNGRFIAQRTSGFEEFTKRLSQYPLEKVSQVTGVQAAQIEEIAREMASVKPALAMTHRSSLFNQAAVHSLNALVGSIGVQRGVLASEAAQYQLRLPPVKLPQTRPAPLASLHQLPEALLAADSSPLEVLWLERTNPVFLSPGPSQWKKALDKVPFIVSFSSFLDETSELADLVLPPHASLEAWQYGFSSTLQGQGVISFAPPVVPPLYDTGDHGDFVLQLAKALGGTAAAALPGDSFVDSLEMAVEKAGAKGSWRQGGWWSFEGARVGAEATLKTKSGKLEFPIRELEETGIPNSKEASDYPLELYVHVPLAFSFGEGAHLPYLHSLAGAHLGEQWESWLEIHPETAKRLRVADGQMVWVESSAGRIQARARHYEGIHPEVVSLPFGLGHAGMGRYAQGVGSNPADVLKRAFNSSGQPLWQETKVNVYAV